MAQHGLRRSQLLRPCARAARHSRPLSQPPACAAAERRDVPLQAILVLGGGQNPSRPSSLPLSVERRLDLALELAKLHPNSLILSSGGGTPHRAAALAPNGQCWYESAACSAYLLQRGARADRLLRESASFDTVGNAFFCATMHAWPLAWERLAVVTSDFHMPRTQAIFYKVFGLVDLHTQRKTQLEFHAASSEDAFAPDALTARAEREAGSRRRFLHDMRGIGSLQQFHTWFFTTHLCYSVHRQHEMAGVMPTIGSAIGTY